MKTYQQRNQRRCKSMKQIQHGRMDILNSSPSSLSLCIQLGDCWCIHCGRYVLDSTAGAPERCRRKVAEGIRHTLHRFVVLQCLLLQFHDPRNSKPFAGPMLGLKLTKS